MKINIYENTLKIMDENRNVIDIKITETYTIYPDKGKKLIYTKTNKDAGTYVCVNSKKEISNFKEI